MRYPPTYPAVARQARSMRIGRCARCHAPVVSDEEHYGTGTALVHGACDTQSINPTGNPTRSAVKPPRRLRQMAPANRIQTTGQALTDRGH